MNSPSVAPSAAPAEPTAERLLGHQRPRIETVPGTGLSSAGQEAVELASMAGLELDPWQRYVLDQGMAERADGDWAAFEVCVNLPRQNGKGAVIEARELAGLFLLAEPLQVHTAHEFKTAKVGFKRIESLITNCDSLRKRVKAVRYTTGEEQIELLAGPVLRFLARSGGSGRGFTGNTIFFDEAMILGEDAMGALLPTMAAVPNPQAWYLGSAGIGALSGQLARLRARALKALAEGRPDPSLAYFEWSIDPHADECPEGCAEHDDIESLESAARANPALGIRLTPEHVQRELLSMGPRVYSRERLGVGEYPSEGDATWAVIAEEAWRALADGESRPADPVRFAIDTTPERSFSAIAVAGTSGEQLHVEITDHRPGTDWVVARAVELQERWNPACWVVDEVGPAGSLIPALRAAGIEPVCPKSREVAQATGQFIDDVKAGRLVHLDQPMLAAALAGAQLRTLGDASAWARRGLSVDISPLVTVTLAAWALRTWEPEPEPDVEPMVAWG
ncbi:terminase [Streptomyces sp. NBRC 109706]|uniref:terminase n=1 Tax=Streptomyces sp. NBRC 109706 TaxID=1550035 RepID=UPI0007830897|nr:terminase [Streptomyces sp. NBRC 109706]